MKQRTWLIIVVFGALIPLGSIYYFTGGSKKAAAYHSNLEDQNAEWECTSQGTEDLTTENQSSHRKPLSDAEWRYRLGKPGHWRYVMLYK